MTKPDVKGFFDEATNTISYVVWDRTTKQAAIIDSLLDFDQASGRTATHSADRMIAFVKDTGLTVEWIIDTHVHADHLTAAPYIKSQLGGRTGIGEHISTVQKVFGEIFNAGQEFHTDGSQFDHLFTDGETYKIGTIEARAIHTPGHTPACMSHLIGGAVFVGDTIFMPDYGTARCDFPGGDAATLYDSIQKLFALPGDTRVFLCHDYKAPGREHHVWETTIGEEKAHNTHIHEGVTKAQFVKMRTERDATLDMPKLILPSVQVNMRAGEMPPAESNGMRYMKIPINAL
ncbi:MAG: MBL fold metallo-hydrolase [Henriciella sp.]|jgi:glyoxylase-like metal-dependent hydrolase (beta-lactamase superfamily II)|uniref:MBL fold metallo-hydrolase n=1 Tax=Henriciella sp. TaxID=1968823 RepID=UPI000C0FD204|nr:MBL fold metallo-hydrolase [Henriciella sp.]MAN74835.1 MBL fold metallo-hydrolase [Henriciella sp.]MBF34146.1 MBL fold metallo-hydrolase [Hyphomonadaceae bacterium]PHR81964.1 MAG: MBL fold metallo-hydrolase [Henriciella sp.]|tara:strand:+ start:883 stop:1749 length:867 start_codon:yes stop_codon:yes gene_type:complete